MSIRDKIRKLEKARQSIYKSRVPCVVEQRENETLDQAVERTYEGMSLPEKVNFIVVPQKLTEQEWVERYSQ